MPLLVGNKKGNLSRQIVLVSQLLSETVYYSCG